MMAKWTQEQLTEILDGFPFDSDAGDGLTMRQYLWTLLQTLWVEQEGFSGKRPFGNSGWDYDLFKALVVAGYVEGKLDADGFLDTFDKVIAEKLVTQLIACMCGIELEDE
jgi:hypothetical protein